VGHQGAKLMQKPHQQTLLYGYKGQLTTWRFKSAECMFRLSCPLRRLPHQVATNRMLRDIMPMHIKRNHLEPVLHFSTIEKHI
jgi:hypothetical protein